MANKTISDLNELTIVSNSDVLLVETNTKTSKVTKENLLKEVNEQLNTKSNVSHTHDEYVTDSELDAKGLATEAFVTNKIAEASLSGGEVDLSGLATKDELATKADISSIPTKTSQLNNDSGFITSVPSEYITESELDAKGYLTEHQDISMKADKTELHTHDNKTVLDGITSTKVTEWNNKSDFDGNYNSLTNKPTIPTVDVDKNYVDTQLATKANIEDIPSLDGYATETFVTNKIAEASLSSDGEVDLSGYATKDELNSSLATKSDTTHNHDTVYAPIEHEHSQYLTSVPSEYVTDEELNAKGYLTSHQDISGKADKLYVDTELAKKSDKTHTHSYNNLTDKPTIPSIDNLATKEELTDGLATKANVSHTHDQYLTEQELSDYALKTEIPTVPTKTSQLTNDSGFINSIPSEYITETELNDKGYLTEHQDISNLATKAEVQTKADVDHIHSQYLTTIPTEYITETELGNALSTKANTSDIPSLEGYATETYVTNKIAEASLSGGEVDLSGYATKDELTVGLAKKSNVEHIHSYDDLTNKPTIPSVEGLASTEYVDNAVSNITIDTSNLATKDELNTKANSVHTHISSDITGLSIVATSGDYNDLLKKPVIPTVDVNKEYVDAQLSTKANISDIPDLTGYALKTEIPSVPTNTSELVNDSGFLTSVPNEYITETELSAKGYLVSSDIVGKANISDLSSVATTGDYNDLLNKPNVTNGKDGENGATFTPNVDTDGNLSWTNDKELENPTTINIKGAKGDKGEQGIQGEPGEKGADGRHGQDGLTTSISLNGTVYSHVDGTITLPDYPTIPTKTSDLINDSEFLTSIPSEYITETELNEKGYLTEHQDISNLATKAEVDTLKQSVSDGKRLVADAITGKGVATSATDTFQTMANNINNITISSGDDVFYGSIIVDKSSVTVNNVKTDSIKVKLSQRPSSTQVVTLTSNGHVSLSLTELTFTTANWNVEQSIIITHNSGDYTDHTGTITLSSPNVSDVNIQVNVVNSELIEYSNIVVSSTSISFNKGESTTFYVKLQTQPTVSQTVKITVDDSNVKLDKTDMTFSTSNWNEVQTVIVSSSTVTTATITLSSDNVPSKTVSVKVLETQPETTDGIEIVCQDDNFTVQEGSSYYVSFSFRGTIEGEKTLAISCNDSKINLSHSYVTVRQSNFNDSFYLSLYADTTDLPNGRTAKVTFSGDGFVTKEVTFTIKNNNVSDGTATYGNIVLDKTSVHINGTESATIGVKLDVAPSANQLVNISIDNNNTQVDKTGLTFNASNYSQYQYVTVRKGLALANIQATDYESVITFSSNSVESKTVNVTITVQGEQVPTENYGEIIISNGVLTINEGNTTTFTVRLATAPTSNQIVNVSVGSSSVATVSPSTLTFTPSNYSTNQTVTVNAIKDSTSYVDNSTQITLTSNNVESKTISLTVKNTDQAPGGDLGGDEDTDTYLPLEDSNVRNLVPYISTYYIKPTVKTGEEIILNYFVTDYYGRSYTNNSNFYNYKIIVKRQGKSNIIARNITGGDHSISLGSYDQEGTYHFSIIAIDQYGRKSHELFNYVRVRNADDIHTNVYNVTDSDLSTYSVTINNDKEEREYVTVSGANFEKIEYDTQKETVQSAIDNAYNNSSVSSGKYKVFIPMFGASSGTDYKGKTNGWKCLKVKYGSGFDATTFLNECATNRQNLQRLISEKANAGYNKIVLRKGTYMIDNTPIDIPNGITLDLNGSTIKMCPITGSGALMMRMTDCTDTHLCNGTIEGDYFAHDYAGSTSNSEWVSGVEMGGSCRYCSIRDLTIKNITGYGLQNSISSTSPNGNTFYGTIKVADLEQGDIDRETGQNISCAYRLRSGVSNILAYQGNSDFISMSIHLNYQGNEFSSWNYYMYFYDSGNNFIQAVSAYQYRQVKIPQNAYYVRIVILGERLKSDWNLHYQFFRVPTHCEFRDITIDNARCVGMAQGQMKDFLVQDCIITNSGQSSATCSYDAEDGWDGMQDVFFENFRIYDCPNNGFLTCAGHNFVVNNMHSDAIYMWERTRWAVIKNSTFDTGCIIRGGGEANIVQHGVTRFYNNTVSAPDYSNYLFMTVAKNCTYTTAPKNGILVNTVVNGATMDRTVYNNDSNNQITDDIGKSTDNVDYGNTGSQNVSVSKVTLNKTSISLALNGTEQLVATVFPTNASNQGVTWSSSATNIASVSSSGLVTGRGSGSATITARTDDRGYTATCSVQVTSSSSGTVNYNLTVSSSLTITQGENTYITYSVSNTLPSNCTYEIKRNGSYWCNASPVSTNRINASTTQFSTGTYDNLTLCISYNGAVIATSNTFTLTINQENVTESAILSPASCQIYVGNNQTFTLVNTNATINNYYISNGKVSIYGTTSTSITVTAQSVGTDYVNVILSDGTSLSSSITIQANTSGGGSIGGGSTGGDSGGGSTGGGSSSDSEVDANGLVIIKYPALQKPKPTTWCALGDSITAGTGAGGSSYSYANVCANLAGITAIHNHGIAGSCICAGYNTALTEPGIETAFCNRFGEMSASADLITVLGSVNDHRADVKIGSPTSTDKNDFYGALYVLITGLKQKYPNGRIVFITPFKISGWDGKNMYGFSLQDFRNAIVTQCNRFQIEVVDLFSEEQFSWLKGLHQGWFYPYDYYHPTPEGHQAIASWLKDQLFGDGSSSGGTGGTTTTYGNIVVENTSYTMNENTNKSVNVSLDKAPTNNQTIYITTDGNVSVNTSSLTFTPSNYNTPQSFTLYSGYAGSGIVTLASSNVDKVQINVTINSTSSGGGGISNSSDTAITQQYSSSHEATPNIANPPSGAYNWKYAPRINPDGSFPNSTWNAFGHWMTTYKIEEASYYDNVGLLLQNPKAWIWNTSTRSWDVLSFDFEWGSWYLEDFYDDGNSTIANSITWEAGVSGNHSTWVKIKQDSTTQGRCFHPWGYQKNWRSNSSWSNNGQPYIVTKVDFKLVKYDENGADNLDSAQLVVNSGGDWWSEVGATWKPDWSTNRDMCVGKYIKATRELKRAWATNLPSSWSYGLPMDDDSLGGGDGGGSTTIPVTGINISEWDVKLEVGQQKTLTYNVIPTNATNQTVYWSNTNSGVATISNTNSTITINAVGVGYTCITGTTAEGNFAYDVHVNVSGSSSGGSPGETNIPVTDITVDAWDVKLEVGQTRQMVASVIPSDATNQTIHWTTSAADVATVSSNGLITAKKEGYSLVTATTDDGNYSYEIHVNVSGSSSGGGGNTEGSSVVTPSEATMAVGSTQRFTLSSGTIDYTYFANGNCSVWSSGSNYVEIKAETTGQDCLNIVLSDGSSISVPITIVASGGSSGGSGGNTTIDGLVTIQYPATKQNTAGEWIALGDSITYGYQIGGNSNAYPARVARASSLRANNHGETGRTVAIGASGATVPDERSFCNYYTSLPSSCAMITVFGGVNDFLLGVPLGSSSSTDKSTFYGALNTLADGLKSRYSGSRIVFFTPIRIGGHENANSAGHTLKDYRNAIVQVCNNKGIEVLDLYSLDSMDADISVSNYMGTWDTTHPNGNGHQAIADYIVAQMI